MPLRQLHQAAGAKVADDGIPLYYTDLMTEYTAALNAAVLLDRSHEGRVQLTGDDREALLQRISTNNMLKFAEGEGRPTLFTTNTARIIDRALVYRPTDDPALTLIASPGRGAALANYLQRNIFFRDAVQVHNHTTETAQFALHGATADAIADVLHAGASQLAALHGVQTVIDGVPVFLARRKPYSGAHWLLMMPAAGAAQVWQAVLAAGASNGLIAAGSLTFNTLRIRAGRPGLGRELTESFIPLELGLWDEVSFTKGCYTGQEILARMESRGRLAKTIARFTLSQAVDQVPVDLLQDQKRVGTLTSCVTAPDGTVFAVGVVKPSVAVAGGRFDIVTDSGTRQATLIDLPGVQPAILDTESTSEN